MTKKKEIEQATCGFAKMVYSKYEVSSYGIRPYAPLYSKDLLEELKLKRDIINNNIVTYMEEPNYTHDQVAQELVWTIAHNLGHNPKVIVVDQKNKSLFPIITYSIAGATLTLTFGIPTCGKAFLI